MHESDTAPHGWLDRLFREPLRQVRWSFLPPLMVYFAAGGSGLTAIVATFYVKEYLDLSAAFLAGLGFWAGLPWALKMPLGHLVDLIWRWKAWLIWLGAGLISASLAIMVGLVTQAPWLPGFMRPEAWFVLSTLLAPVGYVVQDAVADAMTVDAVPRRDARGRAFDPETLRSMHTTMQTMGRFALITGASAVAALNIFQFSGIDSLGPAEKSAIYARIYTIAFIIPAISVSGVALATVQNWHRLRRLIRAGRDRAAALASLARDGEPTRVNWWYFIGGGAFVAMTLTVGLSDVAYAQEIVFAGSMAIVLLLMRQLIRALEPAQARALIGTAIIIFAFRAVPLNGAAGTWFQIDILGFDQRFLSVLSLITSLLTLIGMVVLRPLMANNSIAYIVVLLSLASGVLSLPDIGLYYGIQNWTAAMTGGVVDARFIAVIDTAVESPLGQVAMIPMLAWIARNAPVRLKATFFAVMASFTNLALSASSLGTKYLNQIFTVTREVRGPDGAIITTADYAQLGWLLITVAIITVAVPLLTALIVQSSPLRSND